MRLGAQVCRLEKGTLSANIYQKAEIVERHRHRYEVNEKYFDLMHQRGLNFVGTGTGPCGEKLMEILEHPSHPFYIGCQYHPEYRSSHLRPHPLFMGLFDAMQHVANTLR